MALKFQKGDPVRQVVTVIKGEVVDFKIIDNDVQYCVAYTGADGERHERYFTESEIEPATSQA